MDEREFGRRIQKLIDKQDLSFDETEEMFADVFSQRQNELNQGAFLSALVSKGETIEEIAGAWKAIDEMDTVHVQSDLPPDVFENSGTGMDSVKTFNVSSAAAIVAAACGVPMARHCARAITSKCGAVDILESAGIGVECDVETVARSIRTAGIGIFNGMSAQVHPGALGRILSQIRFGSTLNIAASLASPCRPSFGVRGVYAERLVEPTAELMRRIGYRRGMVVYGKDSRTGGGMDELSVSGESVLLEFDEQGVTRRTVHPSDFGLPLRSVSEIAAEDSVRSERDRFLSVISGKGPEGCTDFTCLNAAAILYIAGKTESVGKGVAQARDCLLSGAAAAKLDDWRAAQVSGSCGGSC